MSWLQVRAHRTQVKWQAAEANRHSIEVWPVLNLDNGQLNGDAAQSLASVLGQSLRRFGPATVEIRRDISSAPQQLRQSPPRARLDTLVRSYANKTRVTIRLENASDAQVLYRKTIEVVPLVWEPKLIRTTAAAEIYKALDEPDSAHPDPRLRDPGLRNNRTRDLLSAGNALIERRSLSDFDRGIECFRKALASEPGSAVAQSCLAAALAGRNYLQKDDARLAEADKAALTALNLNPEIADPHNAISLIRFIQGRSQESLDEMFLAYELGNSRTRQPSWGGASLKLIGQPQRAIGWFRRSEPQAQRPGMNEFMIGDCWADLCEDERAAASYRTAADLFPELPEGWIGPCRLALLHHDFLAASRIASSNSKNFQDFVFSREMAAQVEFFSRNFSAAAKLYAELASADPEGGGSFYGAVSFRSALGRLRQAARDKTGVKILEQELAAERGKLRSVPTHPETLYRLAAIESCLGMVKASLEHLKVAVDNGWIDYRSTQLDPRFDNVAADPAFQKIIERLQHKVATLQREEPPSQLDDDHLHE